MSKHMSRHGISASVGQRRGETVGNPGRYRSEAQLVMTRISRGTREESVMTRRTRVGEPPTVKRDPKASNSGRGVLHPSPDRAATCRTPGRHADDPGCNHATVLPGEVSLHQLLAARQRSDQVGPRCREVSDCAEVGR